MAASKNRSPSFVERHRLWNDAQADAADAVGKAVKREKLELVRFSFCDQHGVLRGKTLVAAEAARALRDGVTMTSTLLAKDTSHRTVFSVFGAGNGNGNGPGLSTAQGAGNIMMVADPTTFRVLPWAERTGWVLCDLYGDDGAPVPVSTRALHRAALARLAKAGFAYMAGLEVEFHLFKVDDPRLAPATLTWPAEPPAVSHTTRGYQYLTEAPIDQVDGILQTLRHALVGLGLPLRSMEVEFGPSQFEFTFAPETGMAPADNMVLLRGAMKQVAQRHGYLVSFMCRPGLPNVLASGWHLHQSLLDLKSETNDLVSYNASELLSPIGRSVLAGLIANARAAAAFATPTLNGYKRYHGVNSMAPIQAVWGRDNRGAMIRVMGAPGDTSTHLENRVGEPLANPYLYMASQIHAGLDGIARKLKPGPAVEVPYELSAEPLPKNLMEALDALHASRCFREWFGDAFVDYFIAIKRAEVERAGAKAGDPPDRVTEWEHREYFDLA
jgi:glutamine synthetase